MLGNGPAHDVNGPHVMAQEPIYNSCICQGARDKLPPPSPPIYMADPMGQGTPLLSSPHLFLFGCLRHFLHYLAEPSPQH